MEVAASAAAKTKKSDEEEEREFPFRHCSLLFFPLLLFLQSPFLIALRKEKGGIHFIFSVKKKPRGYISQPLGEKSYQNAFF